MKHSLELTVELFRLGDFELLELFDKQEQALQYLTDDTVNELTYGGAARGGKSWLLCTWKLFTRLAYPGSVGLIAREEMTKLKDTTFETFKKVMKYYGLVEGEDYAIVAGKNIEFANGSKELFRDLKFLPEKDPKFDRIGSYDLTDVAVDEAQQVHWLAIQALKARLSVLEGTRKAVNEAGELVDIPWKLHPKMFYGCNPSKNWIYTKFYKPFMNKTLPERMKFIPALPKDNPHVPQSYIDNLMTADLITRERLLYGNFDYDDDPNSLSGWKEICDLFTNDHVEPNPMDKKLVSDLAMKGRDKFITMFWEGMVGRVTLDKPKATGKSIEDDLRAQKKLHNVPNSRIIADSDGLGAYLSSYIENITEFHGGSSPTDKKFGNLKDQCAFKLAEKINAGELYIVGASEDQEEEIKRQLSICLKQSANEDDNKKRLIKKSEMREKAGCSPDYMDVLIMSMLKEIEVDEDVFA